MKRYAIVRVDNCPSRFEKGFNDYFVCDGRGKDMRLCGDKINCKKCNYGDTKEQLIKKVAQVIFKRKIKAFKKVVGVKILSKKDLKQIYEKCLENSKEIVEFLGVVE